MLIEIRSDVLKVGKIPFGPSLNVILGDDNATNSIGKSTLLMLIDFAMGGQSMLEHHTDLVSELGHHDYYFTFKFQDEILRFRRGTREPEAVYTCDDKDVVLRPLGLEEYTAILKQSYKIDIGELSFRSLIGLYLRVWGKSNLAVDEPLQAFAAQPQRESIDTLIKTFDQYGSVYGLSQRLRIKEDEKKAHQSANKHGIVTLVGKSQYLANEERIAELESEIEDIRANLARFSTDISEVVSSEVLKLKVHKDRMLDTRVVISGRLERTRRNLNETRNIKSQSFSDLVNFFPDVNQSRVERIEEFHNGVAKLLRAELKESERQLERQLQEVETEIEKIDAEISSTLSCVEKPAAIVDQVVKVAVELHDARIVNKEYEDVEKLKENVRDLSAELSEEKLRILKSVQDSLNKGMQSIVEGVFGSSRKSPHIELLEKRYSFTVHEDTGTGTAYVGLIIFDLTVFLNTQLPAIAHDSLLFKNIENDSVARLLKVYLQSDKQSFIAIDEIKKYGFEATDILQSRKVIQLDNQNVLFIRDWRKN